MLSTDDLLAIAAKCGLTPTGIAYVLRVRSQPPSRNVRGGRRSMVSHWMSDKMGHSAICESVSCELPLAVALDKNPLIHEFWDQPEPIKITYTDEDGHKRGFWYTPDFLSITNSEFTLWEAKQEDKLYALREKKPRFYELNPSGEWHMPRAEEASTAMGLVHRVYVSNRNDNLLVSNVTFLQSLIAQSPFSNGRETGDG